MDFIYEEKRIYAVNDAGAVIAEITFPEITPGVLNLEHTFVDDSLRGQGIAGQLMLAVVNHAMENELKIFPTCSYAVRWLEKNSDYADIFVNSL